MNKLNDLIKFVADETAVEDVTENTDIVSELGCYGDDFFELMEKYAKVYNVDMNSFLWYFHSSEEGVGILALHFLKRQMREYNEFQ